MFCETTLSVIFFFTIVLRSFVELPYLSTSVVIRDSYYLLTRNFNNAVSFFGH